jgi:hypothetical protein
LPIAEDGSYSEENLEMTKAISAWKLFNKNVVSEVNELKNHIDKTLDMRFAADLPVLLFTTKEDQVSEDGKNLETFFKTRLTDSPSSRVVVLGAIIISIGPGIRKWAKRWTNSSNHLLQNEGDFLSLFKFEMEGSRRATECPRRLRPLQGPGFFDCVSLFHSMDFGVG